MKATHCLCACAFALVTSQALGQVTFENAWIRAPLPGQSVTAGYCDIVNRGAHSVAIVGFSGPASGTLRIEMHETTDHDGMVRMRPLKSLTIAPHTTVSLVPGGKHLMLFGLQHAAEQITLKALFANQSDLAVTFSVVPLRSGEAEQ